MIKPKSIHVGILSQVKFIIPEELNAIMASETIGCTYNYAVPRGTRIPAMIDSLLVLALTLD